MNRQGHVALGVFTASASLFLFPTAQSSLLSVSLYMVGAALGSLLPDLDHKTGTLSNLIQLSARKRKVLNYIGYVLLLIASMCMLLEQKEWMYVAAISGGVALAVSRLRTLVLIGVGLLSFYYLYVTGVWLYVLPGILFCLLPFVKHRGIVHSPELALLLVLLVMLQPANESWLMSCLLGGLVGWCMHLVGDALGREGIQSLLFPKAKVALRMVDNGSVAERFLANGCWLLSMMLIIGVLLN